MEVKVKPPAPAQQPQPQTVRGYKIVDSSLRATNHSNSHLQNGFQFIVGQIAMQPGKLKLCSNGFHFCYRAIDCVMFSGKLQHPYRYLQVVPMSEVATAGSKSATLDLLIEKELTATEWLARVHLEYQEGQFSGATTLAFNVLEIGIIERDIKTMELALTNPSIDRSDAMFQSTAAMCGHLDVMKFLMRHGITNCAGSLLVAILNGHLPVVEFLLQTNAKGVKNGFVCAARTGRVDIASALLDALVVARADIPTCLGHALEDAAKEKKLSMVKFLVEKGATSVYSAACLGDDAIMDYLISIRGFDLSKAITYASEHEYMAAMAYFIQKRAKQYAMIDELIRVRYS